MSSYLKRTPEFDTHELDLLRALHEEEKRRMLQDVRPGRLGSIRSNAEMAAGIVAAAALSVLALT